jgi:dynein regulatory complex protein 1
MDPTDFSSEKQDREVRIKQRRARIEERKRAKNDMGKGRQLGEDDLEEQSQGARQTQQSLSHIDRVKAHSIENVTSIRVQADNSENQRRIREEDNRQSRLRRLQEEAIESGKRNAAVEMRWQELMNYNMPGDLMIEMTRQKEGCRRIIGSKDTLISEFNNELKAKDEEYVKSLKQQEEDISQLIARMRKQYNDLQKEYEVELEQIEDAFMRERDELLGKNKKEIDDLFDKRRHMEIHFMEAKQEREEKYQEEIQNLRVRDAEDYNKLKIKLETDIQTLEQQLEEMRATYQLNTEKLDYNYRVLTERDMENSATLSQQKRKLARLKDALNSQIAKYHATDSEHKAENQLLTEDYRRITKQYKDLQNKFRHFEVADNERYQEVWNMHKDEAAELVERVLQADEIIHQQLLGLEWQPPSMDVFAKVPKGVGTAQGGAAAEEDEGKTAEEGKVAEQARRPVSSYKVKVMLKLLAQEAGFLIDGSTREKLDLMSKAESSVAKADSILKALGIENEKDVERLLTYFFENVYDNDGSDDEGTGNELKVKPDDVVRVVKQYVLDREDERRDDPAMQLQAATMAEKAAAAQRARRRKEERQFWSRIANIVPPKTKRVWGAAAKMQVKYVSLLKEREKAVVETQALANQNNELKALLNQYLGADVNDELHIPPTQVIRIDPE